jgi:hypothetical protein
VPGYDGDRAIAKPTARKADADEPEAAVQENGTV